MKMKSSYYCNFGPGIAAFSRYCLGRNTRETEIMYGIRIAKSGLIRQFVTW